MPPATSPASSPREALGHVVSIGGAHGSVRLPAAAASSATGDARVTVGRFMALKAGKSTIVGVITEVDGNGRAPDGHLTARIDLMGEIRRGDNGRPLFQRGITNYPVVGDPVDVLGSEALRVVYDTAGAETISIGNLQQDESIPAYVKVDEMLRKHFAFFGGTGVGKSSGVAVLLREILASKPNQRIFLIDPHNEYARCFRDKAYVLTPKNLKLPFWLFNFEEMVDVFFRGRPGLEEEVEILAQAIPQAKSMFASTREGHGHSLRKLDPGTALFTVDTPVPYRLADLIALIDERMGKLENRSVATKFSRLIARIETVRKDLRYGFMFDNANVGGDTMVEVLSQLFRLPPDGKPVTVMQLAGFPAEVVDSVVSVLGRMAFEFGLWSDGAIELLFVCEEAHRYAPGDKSIGFGPTRKAISRIAKEGRKYGVFLGLITQRAAELDSTIISQCSTLFAMRMANERDQAVIRAAVSDAAGSLLSFVPSLGTRETFAFGEGVALPTRLRFKRLEPDVIPRSESVASAERLDATHGLDTAFIERVVERWRGATMGNKRKAGDGLPDEPEKPERLEKLPPEPEERVPLTLDAERALLREALLNHRREPAEAAKAPGALVRSLRK
jgi:DNA helicase HerA-like ATPase